MQLELQAGQHLELTWQSWAASQRLYLCQMNPFEIFNLLDSEWNDNY